MSKATNKSVTVSAEAKEVEEVIVDPETTGTGSGPWTVKPGEYLSIVAGNRVLFQGHGVESVTVKMRGE
ncbi:MAG: hypothetical protein IJ153_10960 [Clostridia bacterium]|nr:hypothetical protein [Clostridia bacterium]MBQ9212206.1 hypothetical protein [Clostridia bacterium]